MCLPIFSMKEGKKNAEACLYTRSLYARTSCFMLLCMHDCRD